MEQQACVCVSLDKSVCDSPLWHILHIINTSTPPAPMQTGRQETYHQISSRPRTVLSRKMMVRCHLSRSLWLIPSFNKNVFTSNGPLLFPFLVEPILSDFGFWTGRAVLEMLSLLPALKKEKKSVLHFPRYHRRWMCGINCSVSGTGWRKPSRYRR